MSTYLPAHLVARLAKLVVAIVALSAPPGGFPLFDQPAATIAYRGEP